MLLPEPLSLKKSRARNLYYYYEDYKRLGQQFRLQVGKDDSESLCPVIP